jgi:hypothetical protein
MYHFILQLGYAAIVVKAPSMSSSVFELGTVPGILEKVPLPAYLGRCRSIQHAY